MAKLKELLAQSLAVRDLFTEHEKRRGEKTWSRADILRGFVADVGALSKLTMAADGLRDVPDHSKRLGHELADCLWSVLVLSHEYNVDLEAEFERLMSELTRKLLEAPSPL